MELKLAVDVYGFGLSVREPRGQFEDGFKKILSLLGPNISREIIYFLLKLAIKL